LIWLFLSHFLQWVHTYTQNSIIMIRYNPPNPELTILIQSEFYNFRKFSHNKKFGQTHIRESFLSLKLFWILEIKLRGTWLRHFCTKPMFSIVDIPLLQLRNHVWSYLSVNFLLILAITLNKHLETHMCDMGMIWWVHNHLEASNYDFNVSIYPLDTWKYEEKWWCCRNSMCVARYGLGGKLH
jgi:hypothetical protein